MFEVFGLASTPNGDLREIHGLFLGMLDVGCLLFRIIILINYLLGSPKIMAPACTMFNRSMIWFCKFIKILIERQRHPALIDQGELLFSRVFSQIFKWLHVNLLGYISSRCDFMRRGTFNSRYSFSWQSFFIFVLCPPLLACILWKLKF